MDNIIKCLERLNIKESEKVARTIYTNFRSDINKYFCGTPKIMVGGSNKTEFIANRVIFNFYRTDYGDIAHYHLYQNDDENKLPECLFIIVDKKERIAILENITYNDQCFNNDDKKVFNPSGGLLLSIAINFINKLHTHYKFKHIQLLDDSEKYCNGNTINLSLMYTLMCGHTWYGKRGFIPKVKNKYEVDEHLLKRYNANTKIMQTVKVKHVINLKKYLIDSYNKVKPKKVKLDEILLMYERNKNNLLSKFISEYLQDFQKMCDMFSLFYEDLSDDIGLYDFNGKPFIRFYK